MAFLSAIAARRLTAADAQRAGQSAGMVLRALHDAAHASTSMNAPTSRGGNPTLTPASIDPVGTAPPVLLALPPATSPAGAPTDTGSAGAGGGGGFSPAPVLPELGTPVLTAAAAPSSGAGFPWWLLLLLGAGVLWLVSPHGSRKEW